MQDDFMNVSYNVQFILFKNQQSPESITLSFTNYIKYNFFTIIT
jgi:hypothetical protein